MEAGGRGEGFSPSAAKLQKTRKWKKGKLSTYEKSPPVGIAIVAKLSISPENDVTPVRGRKSPYFGSFFGSFLSSRKIEIIFHSTNIPNLYLLRMQIPDFWCPVKLTDVDGSIKSWELPKGRYDFRLKNSAGLRFEAEEARLLINAGSVESPSVTHAESLRIGRVQDKLRRLLGVHFPEDELEY